MKIINIGAGSWYPKGTDRLHKKLLDQGITLNYKKIYSNNLTRYDGYQHKINYIIENLERYGSILWLDCSVVPLRPFSQFLEDLKRHHNTEQYGCWAYRTGYTVGQTCNDRSLQLSGFVDDGLTLPEYATGIFYLDNQSPIAARFKHYVNLGLHKGSRDKEEGDSTREEFLHHRQDQSLLTLAINNIYPSFEEHSPDLGDIVHYNYKNSQALPKHYFLIAGGYGNTLPDLPEYAL